MESQCFRRSKPLTAPSQTLVERRYLLGPHIFHLTAVVFAQDKTEGRRYRGSGAPSEEHLAADMAVARHPPDDGSFLERRDWAAHADSRLRFFAFQL